MTTRILSSVSEWTHYSETDNLCYTFGKTAGPFNAISTPLSQASFVFQCFDTVGCAMRLVNIASEMTYYLCVTGWDVKLYILIPGLPPAKSVRERERPIVSNSI